MIKGWCRNSIKHLKSASGIDATIRHRTPPYWCNKWRYAIEQEPPCPPDRKRWVVAEEERSHHKNTVGSCRLDATTHGPAFHLSSLPYQSFV